ncbi:hypothetical protein FJZ33_09425 [Candidatus Poribacteria bacterium]|nr:hypothetical protein [Candidatus Poribacteria bacterium]
MLCNDPLVNYLKSFGYNVIRLPKEDVKPLQVLSRKGKDLNRLGDLVSLLVTGSNIPLPAIIENKRLANFSGQRTSDLSPGVGISILGSFISAMGGSNLGLGIKYQQAKTVAFEFQDVYEDKVEIIKLDQYLTDADINPASKYMVELLEEDELYITTATIKSTKFAVEAKKSNGVALDISIPEIQGVVGGNVKVSGSLTVSSKIIYESSFPLVFGFQAVRLFYDQGHYTAFEFLSSNVNMKAFSNLPSDGTQHLMTDSPFIRLSAI